MPPEISWNSLVCRLNRYVWHRKAWLDQDSFFLLISPQVFRLQEGSFYRQVVSTRISRIESHKVYLCDLHLEHLQWKFYFLQRKVQIGQHSEDLSDLQMQSSQNYSQYWNFLPFKEHCLQASQVFLCLERLWIQEE